MHTMHSNEKQNYRPFFVFKPIEFLHIYHDFKIMAFLFWGICCSVSRAVLLDFIIIVLEFAKSVLYFYCISCMICCHAISLLEHYFRLSSPSLCTLEWHSERSCNVLKLVLMSFCAWNIFSNCFPVSWASVASSQLICWLFYADAEISRLQKNTICYEYKMNKWWFSGAFNQCLLLVRCSQKKSKSLLTGS